MVDVEIECLGEKNLPDCTCGKCITRRKRKSHFNSLPYSKNTNTTYNVEYPWKTPEKGFEIYELAKHNGFENSYKENLPHARESLMRSSYRPCNLTIETENKEPARCFMQPFIAHTTNEEMFPKWTGITCPKGEEIKSQILNIPMRGSSTYRDNNKRYDTEYYKNRDPMCFGKDSLRFYGIVPGKSVSHESYKPIKLSPEYKVDKYTAKSIAFLEPDLPSSYATSTYKTEYQPYDDSQCKLRPILNKKGIRYLVI